VPYVETYSCSPLSLFFHKEKATILNNFRKLLKNFFLPEVDN
jgi:hypothetical protein